MIKIFIEKDKNGDKTCINKIENEKQLLLKVTKAYLNLCLFCMTVIFLASLYRKTPIKEYKDHI